MTLQHPLRVAAGDKLEAALLPACCSPASFAPSNPFRTSFRDRFSISTELDHAPLPCPERLRPEINTRTLLSPCISLRKIFYLATGKARWPVPGQSRRKLFGLLTMHCCAAVCNCSGQWGPNSFSFGPAPCGPVLGIKPTVLQEMCTCPSYPAQIVVSQSPAAAGISPVQAAHQLQLPALRCIARVTAAAACGHTDRHKSQFAAMLRDHATSSHTVCTQYNRMTHQEQLQARNTRQPCSPPIMF
jgi:hypothetical protein